LKEFSWRFPGGAVHVVSILHLSPAGVDYNRSSGVGKGNVVSLLCLSFHGDMSYFKKIATICRIEPKFRNRPERVEKKSQPGSKAYGQ
jgi:hypothetical protein